MNPLDQEEHIKRIVCESQTYTEVIKKLGFSKNANYEWIVNFIKENNLKLKPLSFENANLS